MASESLVKSASVSRQAPEGMLLPDHVVSVESSNPNTSVSVNILSINSATVRAAQFTR